MNQTSSTQSSRRFALLTRPHLLTAAVLTASGTASLLATPTAAMADSVIYSNVTTFQGSSYANASNGFATATTTGTGAVRISSLVADDITFDAAFAGQSITSFTFSVANQNAGTVSARARIRFYASDGASGGPGTYLTGFSFNPIKFAPGTGTFTSTLTAGQFVLPTVAQGATTETIWAGICFDNSNGGVTTGQATNAQLAKLGQGLFDPPTVGSSTDIFFQTSGNGVDNNGGPGSGFLVNNPNGSFFNFNPPTVANFGWAFTATTPTTATTPAPSSLLVVGLGGLPMLSMMRRRRTAKK